MMHYSFERRTESLLAWKGVLTRERAVDLRKELIAAMRESDRITVNLDAVASADVSCLLLLCAAKRYADSERRTLVLEGAKNAAIAQVVKRYGYGTNKYCLAQCNGVCLWINERPVPGCQPVDAEE